KKASKGMLSLPDCMSLPSHRTEPASCTAVPFVGEKDLTSDPGHSLIKPHAHRHTHTHTHTIHMLPQQGCGNPHTHQCKPGFTTRIHYVHMHAHTFTHTHTP